MGRGEAGLSRIRARSPDTVQVSVDGPIENYRRKMAELIEEASRLDGLEELAAHGRAPLGLLRRIQRVILLFDDYVLYALGKFRKAGTAASCRLECDHCCHQMPAGLSALEIIHLYNGLRESRAGWRFFKRCLASRESWSENLKACRSGGAGPADPMAAPMRFHMTRNPCPFLRDHLCQVYAFRPLACRVHFAVTPCHWCDPTHFQFPFARAMNIVPGERFREATRRLDERLNLGVSEILACGLLEFTVNVMGFERIRWTS